MADSSLATPFNSFFFLFKEIQIIFWWLGETEAFLLYVAPALLFTPITLSRHLVVFLGTKERNEKYINIWWAELKP